MQPGSVSDLSGKFTGKTEVSWGHLEPTPNAIFWWNGMKRRIHFNCREIVGIKFQPVSFWQIRRVENVTPVFKAPRARADAYLLLIGQIQNDNAMLASILPLEKGSLLEMWGNIPGVRWGPPKLDWTHKSTTLPHPCKSLFVCF